MTVEEYTKKKNELIEGYIYETLVPESQMIDLYVTSYMVSNMQIFIRDLGEEEDEDFILEPGSILLDSQNCLYCAEYFYTDDCRGCPMYKQGNQCTTKPSTYDTCCIAINNLTEDEFLAMRDDILSLAREFVEVNKYLL